ncbi:hypothetical protein TrST_g9343, partial [Triparma strigata]
MPKRGATVLEDEGGIVFKLRRLLGFEEKEESPPSEIAQPLAATTSATPSRKLMALLFKTLEAKGAAYDDDYVDEVNALLIGFLHRQDEEETKEENRDAAVCSLCEEREPNAKILPCGHSASCSVR